MSNTSSSINTINSFLHDICYLFFEDVCRLNKRDSSLIKVKSQEDEGKKLIQNKENKKEKKAENEIDVFIQI